MKYIRELNINRALPAIGNKALNLQKLAKHGFCIPRTYVCDWRAYKRYLQNEIRLVDELRSEISECLDPGKAYAIRSSANIEDEFDRSFAGQFKSVLNVRSADDILQAIWSIWATTNSQAVNSYLERHGTGSTQLSMAVIIQEMVQSEVAGVS